MKALKLDTDEIYPVLVIREDTEYLDYDSVELPDQLADQFVAATAAFWQAQKEVRAYLAAVRRDEHADDRLREVNKARIERGRRKHYRRPRPATA